MRYIVDFISSYFLGNHLVSFQAVRETAFQRFDKGRNDHNDEESIDETMSQKSNDEGTVFSYTTHRRVSNLTDPVSYPTTTPIHQQKEPTSSKTTVVLGMESVKKKLFSSFSFSSNPTDEYDKKVFNSPLLFNLVSSFVSRFLDSTI
jgi:hypothetical protein